MSNTFMGCIDPLCNKANDWFLSQHFCRMMLYIILYFIHFVRKTGGYPDGDLITLREKTTLYYSVIMLS